MWCQNREITSHDVHHQVLHYVMPTEGRFLSLKVKCVIFFTFSDHIFICRQNNFGVGLLVYPTNDRWECLRNLFEMTHFALNSPFVFPPLVPAARYIHDYLDWSRWNGTKRGRKRRAARRERTKRTAARWRPALGRHSPNNNNIRLLFSEKHNQDHWRSI